MPLKNSGLNGNKNSIVYFKTNICFIYLWFPAMEWDRERCIKCNSLRGIHFTCITGGILWTEFFRMIKFQTLQTFGEMESRILLSIWSISHFLEPTSLLKPAEFWSIEVVSLCARILCKARNLKISNKSRENIKVLIISIEKQQYSGFASLLMSITHSGPKIMLPYSWGTSYGLFLFLKIWITVQRWSVDLTKRN